MIENKPAKVLFKTIMPVLLLITLVISFDLFFPPIALSDLSYNNVMYKILTDFFDVIILMSTE